MRVVSALMFYPRGGSSHAARALTNGLRRLGIDVTLVAGSLPVSSRFADASLFYGPDVVAVDFSAALRSADPMRFDGPPLHPSYEDRPGAPDRVFASLDDLAFERQVRAWCTALTDAGAAQADVLHLHHLTPMNEAAARIAPNVPVVGQLHGTELLMLEQIEAGADWPYAERWATRMRSWAERCAKLIVAPAGVQRACRLLALEPEQLIAIPSGVDTGVFRPREMDRAAFWRGTPVQDAKTVFLYVGRFTAVKRLEQLIEAFAMTHGSAGLVLVGGHPDELEGEHPASIARRLGADSVHLAGWQDQEALPEFFSAADAVVLNSEREQFGQALIEGMACGLPAIAPRALGPASIIDDGKTGWLTEPGDVHAFAAALQAAIDDPAERRRRGALARSAVGKRFSWTGVTAQLADVFEDVVARQDRAPALGA